MRAMNNSKQASIKTYDVKNIRKRCKMTVCEFSIATGIPMGTIAEWEHGKSSPSGAAQTLLMMIDCYEIRFLNSIQTAIGLMIEDEIYSQAELAKEEKEHAA